MAIISHLPYSCMHRINPKKLVFTKFKIVWTHRTGDWFERDSYLVSSWHKHVCCQSWHTPHTQTFTNCCCYIYLHFLLHRIRKNSKWFTWRWMMSRMPSENLNWHFILVCQIDIDLTIVTDTYCDRDNIDPTSIGKCRSPYFKMSILEMPSIVYQMFATLEIQFFCFVFGQMENVRCASFSSIQLLTLLTRTSIFCSVFFLSFFYFLGPNSRLY